MGLRRCGERSVTTPEEMKMATTANTVAREILYRGDVPVLFVKVWLERIHWEKAAGQI